jgi:hypothetical protein
MKLLFDTAFRIRNFGGEVDGSDLVTIQPTGNVGIGTTNPQEKLDVNGAIKIGDTSSTCDSSHRGSMKLVTGSPDVLYMCMYSGSAYNWVMVARGG